LTQLLTHNLTEVRRRSLIVWKAIPDGQLSYRPDSQALSLGESIRHVWTASGHYAAIIRAGKSLDVIVPGEDQPIVGVAGELTYAAPAFADLLAFVEALTPADLDRQIDRSDVGYIRPLGDFLLRVAYHEAVHTGQLLQVMRGAGIERPDVWD
jgi:uncharacterized damage-inducible protein DinB